MRNLPQLFLFLSFASLSLANPTYLIEAADDEDDGYGGYRLPGTQVPSKYVVNLEVQKDVFEGASTEFKGTVIIDFKVEVASNIIKIHAPVTVDSVDLTTDSQSITVTDYSDYNSTTNILSITTEEDLDTTLSYTLTIEYTGVLSTSAMTGFYRSEYYDSDGVLQYLVTSKFEPTHARYAFPSFDEPQLKATFIVSITYPKNLSLNALGNTPHDGDLESIDDDYEKVTFQETPIMSTYLVAFIVSKFTCTAGENFQGEVPYQVCSRPESADDRALAVELGPPLMAALEELTNISYNSQGLGKMDQLAIPDFASGAMENWGLIAYRETALLWDNSESSTTYKQRVATVVAHEFSHSWFGNMVTMTWWDYIFLNEGFARYYQYFASAMVDQMSTWEYDKQFIVDQVQTVLVIDGASSSVALSSKASSPTQISNKFSTVSYNKGASVFRMVEHFMGADNFKTGIQSYLTTNAWSNTAPLNLWNSLAVYTPAENLPSGVALAQVMENWIDEPGYPLITVSVSGNDVILSQSRFLYSGTSDTEWYVPVTYTVSGDDNKFENLSAKVWLLPGETVTLSNVLADNDWIIVNNQESGYYRVNYDVELWEKISEALVNDHTSINVLNRAQIVDDLLNLARAGVVKYSRAIDIERYLAEETEYYPWYAALTDFNYLLRMVGRNSVLGVEISSLMLTFIQNVYDSVSFADVDAEQHINTLKTVLILTNACNLGMEDCVTTAKSLFAQYKEGTSIDRDLRSIVYCNGLRYSESSTSDFQFLWEKFQNTSLASEQLTLIAALGCTKDVTLLKNYLDQSVNSSSGIRLQDFASVWSAVYTSSDEGVNAAYEYIVENYEKLYAYYSSSSSLLSSVVARFTSQEQLSKLEEFIASENIPTNIKSTAEAALASAKNNLAWVAEVEEDLLDFFEVTGGTTDGSTEGDVGDSDPDSVAATGASLGLVIIVAMASTIFL